MKFGPARAKLRLLILMSALIALATAQEFRATVSGTVRDPSGAAVAGARVAVTDVSRNTTVETKTNGDGFYSVPFLVPSTYRVVVEAGGFKTFTRENVVLNINDRLGLNATLEIGAVTENVSVSSEVSPLQTETASRGGLVFSQFVNDVPNDGRTIFNLVFAMPGVFKPSTSQNNEFGIDAIGNSMPNINGTAGGPTGRTWNTDVLVNGTSDVSGNNNLVMTPALASVQELNVMTNTYDSQYGRTGGGIVNVITKSGTNSYHGQLFERLDDTDLDANTWSNNRLGTPKPSTVTNNYGFEIDGPVWLPKLDLRNKLFFMLSFDRLPVESPATRTATVPIAGMLNGDFSGVLAADGKPVTIYDPNTTRLGPDGKTYIRDAFPGNIIPANRINPVGAKIASFYPTANSAGTGPAQLNNFVGTTLEKTVTPQWMGRGDYRLNERHAFYAEYADTYYTRIGGFIWGTNAADPTTQFPRGVRGRHGTVDWSSTLSPTLTTDLRVGVARAENIAQNTYSNGFDLSQIGYPSSLLSQIPYSQFPILTFSQYNQLGSTGYFTGNDSYNLQASVGKVISAHILKFGFEYRSFRDTSISPGNSAGAYSFDRTWTQANPLQGDSHSGNDIADLLLGDPTNGNIQIAVNTAYRAAYYVGYIQDDWKVTRKLTLNLGLRYEYQTPEVERYNRQNRGFGFTTPSPIAAAVSAAPGVSNCPACAAGLKGAYQFVGTSGEQRYTYNPDKNDIQPRIGAAYALGTKTVLRGGFGMYKLGVQELGSTDGFGSTTPVTTSLDGGLTPGTSLSNPFPTGLIMPTGSSLGALTDLGLGISFNDVNYTTPTSYQYSLGFQRQLPGDWLLDVSYVGNYTNHLPIYGGPNSGSGVNLNYIPASSLNQPASFYTQKVANPLAGLVPNYAAANGATISQQLLLYMYPQYQSVVDNNITVGNNRYDAGQVVISKRFAHGFTFMANYTKAKTLQQYSLLNAQDFNPTDPSKSALERRLTTFDVPQRLSIVGVYELPFGRDRHFKLPKFINYPFGDWKLGWNITQQSGFPIQFPNAAPTSAQSAVLPSDQKSLYRWFNTSLFPTTSKSPYVLENFPSVFPDVRFPGVHNFDFSLIKEVPVKERVRLQVRADFTNAFNHPYFTKMQSVDVTNAAFGQLALSQNNDPRKIYIDFKILF